MRTLAIVAFAAGLAGCAALGERQPHRYFVLEPRCTETAAPASALVTPAATTAASFYDTQDIVYSRAAGTRGYYQFNHWTERPQHAIHAALAQRYGSAGPYILATHVAEIYHDAAQAPGESRITVVAELTERAHRTLVARSSFTCAVPARSHDAPGAVAAFDEAVGCVVGQIATWADREAQARRNRDASLTTSAGGLLTMPP
jgi:ABC-type uncharacterized transport system auxiliary subunit